VARVKARGGRVAFGRTLGIARASSIVAHIPFTSRCVRAKVFHRFESQ